MGVRVSERVYKGLGFRVYKGLRFSLGFRAALVGMWISDWVYSLNPNAANPEALNTKTSTLKP